MAIDWELETAAARSQLIAGKNWVALAAILNSLLPLTTNITTATPIKTKPH